MSVGRLAGSGTEAARGSGAQRARAERAAAERTTADRATAEGTTAEGTTAEGTTAGRTTARRTTARRARAEGAAAERTATEDATAERTATDSATAERTATEGATEEGNAAGPTTAGRAPATKAGARGEPGPASNVVIVGGHTGPAAAAPAASAVSVPDTRPAADLFARYTRDYVAGRGGQQVMILEAGCTTAGDDLGVGELREAGADIVISLIDDGQPVTSAALSMDKSLGDCVQGDLRTMPLPPRSQDIVLCALLLQRIQHAELVLDRLVAAIRPGGLLLLHFGDRDSAAGFLDRVLPSAARRAIWRRRRPGQPGPYPVVYERLSSARGVQAYALMRELVIAERRALGGLAGTLTGPPGFLAAQKLIAWLSRGRLTAAHEELLYVLRKPEDRFARIL
jgi:SAM-dependent methyltransferase